MNRVLISVAFVTILFACNEKNEEVQGLRSDGHYESTHDKILYMARFFQDGNVVVLGGLEKGRSDMLGLLSPNGSEINPNVHYVPFTYHENDSVFFTTTSHKGTIDYSGVCMNSDSLSILKKSNINGKTMELKYVFVPNTKN